MAVSKAWEWNKETSSIWLQPSEESYYIAQRWKDKGFKRVLDFGCGLGRHSILFAKHGFHVSAFDLSEEATVHLKSWAEKEELPVDITNADMLKLPYEDNSFDAIFAYHVISHTDSVGIKRIINEISRVLRISGEVFLTLCSKESWSFRDAGYPKLDENTVIKTEEGPEKGVPHFYVDLDDILDLFSNYDIERIRYIDDCYFDGKKQNCKHYFLTASLRAK
ncbi:MAG: class I SAM-dependent methyltransferase [Clostridiaceae bacterium]|jgi:SAM-dependent methyltransferase|nr:class I SAM-dependent methyltransferase [Clostridiaceae bacterium]